MSNNHTRQAGHADWPGLVRAGLIGCVVLATIWLIWGVQARILARSWRWEPALVVLHAGLVLFLAQALEPIRLKRKWRYRLAFLGSACLPLAFAFARLFSSSGGAMPGGNSFTMAGLLGSAALALAGATFGGLTSTRLEAPLWEDNFPPPDRTRREVLERHVSVIGPPEPTPTGKRLFDVCLAAIGLILSAPVWLASILLIWFEDPGPILFVKNSVGRGGISFKQLKLRTMISHAEAGMGPVLSPLADQRVLFSGRFLRKTALDELPQLINILKGEMSFVGPRPQRTVLVNEYLRAMPEYAERHRVLPGLAGLAQVAGDYYLTPRQKLRFDRLYIRYVSLGFDLKLLFLAFLIAFWYRWRKGWDGRLPRMFIHNRI
jgi:lipopolysaccharide/colanic/teichoic acid biosynthesis glycosyltransferase